MLISKETTLQTFDNISTINGLGLEPVIALRDVKEIIKAVPEVDAVPLDKLCELCEETDTRVPCVLCDKIMPEWCKQNNNLPLRWDEEWKCPTWKQLLMKWMEAQDAR